MNTKINGITLSTKGINALRDLVENGKTECHGNVLAALKRRSLIDENNKPTPEGEAWISAHDEQSNDGPEESEELLSL